MHLVNKSYSSEAIHHYIGSSSRDTPPHRTRLTSRTPDSPYIQQEPVATCPHYQQLAPRVCFTYVPRPQPTGRRVAEAATGLTADQSEAVGGQDLVHRLEVSGTTRPAVARATGGDTLGLGTRVERAARVAGLSAHVGASQTRDTALGVVDSHTEAANSAAVDASGGAGAADGGANSGRSGARDGQGAAIVVVDAALQGVSTARANPGHVGAAGEDGAGEGAEGRPASGGGRRARAAAVAGGDEAGGDGETNGAARAAADEVGITTTDGSEGGGHLLDGADLELRVDEADLASETLGLGGAALKRLEDDLVGDDVDVPSGDTGAGLSGAQGAEGCRGGVEAVELGLGLLELGEGVSHDGRRGARSRDSVDKRLVGDGNVDGVAIISNPGTGESRAGSGLEAVDHLDGGDLASNAGGGLRFVQPQVAPHGLEDLRMQAAGDLGGGTVGQGEDSGQEAEEGGDLHDGCGLEGDGKQEEARRQCLSRLDR